MKKLLLLACTIAFTVGCSSNDDNSSNNSNNNTSITPPAWIQGTWAEETIYYDTGSIFGFKFTSNDVCVVSPVQENCFKYLIDMSPETVQVEQSISDTEYKVVMKTIAQTSTIAHIRKISANKIVDISIIDNEFSPTYVKVN